MSTPNSNRKSPILIVAHADRYLEAFSRDRTPIRIVQMPDVKGVEGELVAEKYLEQSLPKQFRDIYFPGYRRATHLIQPTKPSDIAGIQHGLACLAAIDEAFQPFTEEVVTW